MLDFNFNLDMTPIYKQQYDWGWYGKDTLHLYVRNHALTKEGYKTITGDDYVE